MKNGHQRIVEELLGVKDESATCVEDESATCVEDESATCDDEDADKRGTCTEEKKVPVQKVINNSHACIAKLISIIITHTIIIL